MKIARYLLTLWLVLFCADSVLGKSLGLIPMDRDRYRQYLLKESNLLQGTADSLPASWDWRDFNALTPAKDQEYCGSCWAFAVTGALESHIILDFGETFDLSEQTLISCDGPPAQQGCCGGELDAIRFYEESSPREESCYPYLDTDFFSANKDCPPVSMAACYYTCAPVCYNTTGFYTLDVNSPQDVKRSIFREGPCPVGFYVYEDFYTYWDSPLGTPPWVDGVYYHASGDLTGSHGVLAFGWDDATSTYYLKNSWGESGGPFGDGTFRMRTDQISEAANFQVVRGTCGNYSIKLSAPTMRINSGEGPCAGDSKNLRTFYKIDTPFPDRIYGGNWYTKQTYSSGKSVTFAEPIPNREYVSWIKRKGDVAKNTCIPLEQIGEWVVVEYWLVDSEGVESEHRSFTITKHGGWSDYGFAPAANP